MENDRASVMATVPPGSPAVELLWALAEQRDLDGLYMALVEQGWRPAPGLLTRLEALRA